MSLTPEEWTAVESIMERADMDDLLRFKYRTKVSIQSLRARDSFVLMQCDGVCKDLPGREEYVRFLTPMVLNGKTFYLCRDCLEEYENLTGDNERYGA